MEGIRVLVDPHEREARLPMAGHRMAEFHMTLGGLKLGIGYVVEVEVVDKGRRTASAAQGGVHETCV